MNWKMLLKCAGKGYRCITDFLYYFTNWGSQGTQNICDHITYLGKKFETTYIFTINNKQISYKNKARGWRYGSVVKSTCSCRGPRFGSQNPHSSSQPPVTLVPEDLTPSSGLHRHTACVWYI